MSAKEEQFVVRCFAYPGKKEGKQGVFAVCIDLSLVTWRPTLPEAKKSLDEAVDGYFETLLEVIEKGDNVRDLVLRPAPFWPYRLRYHLLAIERVFQKPRMHSDSMLFEDSINIPSSATA